MKLINWDSLSGVAFVILGASIFSAGRAFPVGSGGVPGPGFFPALVGGLLALLGIALVGQGLKHAPSYWEKRWTDPAIVKISAILALLAVYLWLWETVEFVARTPLLLLAAYRVLGEPWLRSTLLAVTITALLYGTFHGLFDVRL